MEPLAHEGMGRLLELQDRCTPLALGADAGAKLLPVSELGNGGALKLGRRKLELPPQPLGRDTTQAPFLAVSNEIAVIDGAASHHPRKLVEMLEMARKEAGWQRLLYAPAVEMVSTVSPYMACATTRSALYLAPLATVSSIHRPCPLESMR